MSNLLIVESPHKAKTIGQWLNYREWKIKASTGHIKNLKKNEYGIEQEGDHYKGNWEIIKDKRGIVNELKELIRNADNVYIATDDDKEGERIAYDLIEYFKIKTYFRVLFHEITKQEILKCIRNPVYIDENKVNAQMARRMIDRVLGYPFTNAVKYHLKKIKKQFSDNITKNEQIIKNIGIGRVSAASLGIIVRNERKILEFSPEKYNKIYINYIYNKIPFSVTNELRFKDEHYEELSTLYEVIRNPSTLHIIEDYKPITKSVSPYPPLITSRILRSANYLFGFEPDYTMSILQKLYDGIELFENEEKEVVGLITYHRTDSFNISDTATDAIIQLLRTKFDEEYILFKKRKFRNKVKSAQEAHECIRPTKFEEKFFPKRIKRYLKKDEFLIYEFIYYRTLSIQMQDARYDRSKIVININDIKFDATANHRLFEGWEKLDGNRIKKSEREDNEEIERDVVLPSNVAIGDEVKPISVDIADRFEKTPPRIGVGRFVTILENNFIGRPSTLPNITKELKKRGFITIENNMLIPTNLGFYIVELFEEKAAWLVDSEHAAGFEEALNRIQEGENPDTLIAEYERLKDEFLKEVGFTYYQDKKNDVAPDEWMVNKATSLSTQLRDDLKNDILSSRSKTLEYINKSTKKLSLGKCPVCKKGLVLERDKNVYCNNKECDFILWKNGVEKFFEIFGKHFQQHTISIYIKHIIKNKKLWMEDLKGKKNNFNALIKIEYNEKYKNYGLTLEFPKDISKAEKYMLVENNDIQDSILLMENKEEGINKDEEERTQIFTKQLFNNMDMLENDYNELIKDNYYKENMYLILLNVDDSSLYDTYMYLVNKNKLNDKTNVYTDTTKIFILSGENSRAIEDYLISKKDELNIRNVFFIKNKVKENSASLLNKIYDLYKKETKNYINREDSPNKQKEFIW
jgi:DNA topoisomerase-1